MEKKPLVSLTFLLVWIIMNGYTASAVNNNLKTTAIAKTCTVSNTLKQVPGRANQIITEFEVEVAQLEGAIFTWYIKKLISNGSMVSDTCGNGTTKLKAAEEALKTVPRKRQQLSKKIALTAAYAGRSGGRLDEFIMAFTQAGSTSAGGCVGDGDSEAASAVLGKLSDCFSLTHGTEKSKVAVSEGYLGDIEKLSDTQTEKIELRTSIGTLAYASLGSGTDIKGGESSSACNLMKGGSGVFAGGNLNAPLRWAGGVLSIGKTFAGDTSSNFETDPGDGTKPQDSYASWTGKPAEKILHFEKALTAYESLEETANSIKDNLKTTREDLEKCFHEKDDEAGGREKAREKFFQYHNDLLGAKEALRLANEKLSETLARYKKEKGELQPLAQKDPSSEGPSNTSVRGEAISQTAFEVLCFLTAML